MIGRRSKRSVVSDEEVVNRLRDTFRHEADALVPFGERVRAIASLEARQTEVAARRRRAVAVAAAVALVVGGGGALAASQLGGPHNAVVGVTAGPNRPSADLPTSPTSSKARRIFTYDASSMPTSFEPLSVTFAPVPDGWVLGTDDCGPARCLALAATSDSGVTWHSLGDPQPAGTTGLALPTSDAAAARIDLGVRFAADGDGWIYGSVDNAAVLWSSSNGGVSWTPDRLPDLGYGAVVQGLETTDGYLQVAVATSQPAEVHLLSQDISTGAWNISPIALAPGTATDLVLQGPDGWVVENGATNTADAALLPAQSTTWTTWTDPCPGTETLLGAAAPASVTAVCPSSSLVLHSSDGGASFPLEAALPTGLAPEAVTESTSASVLVGGTLNGVATIVRTAAVGSGWGTAWSSPTTTMDRVRQIGFETHRQGVAIVAGPAGSELLMTYDGGDSWAVVDFPG